MYCTKNYNSQLIILFKDYQLHLRKYFHTEIKCDEKTTNNPYGCEIVATSKKKKKVIVHRCSNLCTKKKKKKVAQTMQ